MRAEASGNAPGDLICASIISPPGSIPACGMYLIGAGTLFLGMAFLTEGIRLMLFPQMPADFNTGAMLVGISVIFIGPALAAFWSGWSTQSARKICFHTLGVVIERDWQNVFVPYGNVKKLVIEIIEPSAVTVSKAATRGALSLLAGSAAGVGHAIGSTRSYGYIHVTLPDELKPFTIQFDSKSTKAVASIAEPICTDITVNWIE